MNTKAVNIAKTWLLFTLFFIFVIGLGWVFAQVYGSAQILYIAVIFSVVMSFLSFWFSDKLVLRMARAKPLEKKEAPEIYEIVGRLTKEAGLPMPKLYLVNEPAPNAFATGRSPKHAAVAVTSGLLKRLDKKELEGVLAHELSHIGNRDMLISTVVVILVGFITLASDLFMRSLFFRTIFGGRDNRSNVGGVLMLVGIATAILAPLGAMLIQLAISRKREFLADASGALLTHQPENLARALEKIAHDSTPLRAANNTTAHLWLADPFKGEAKRFWLHKLFMTHPPVEERVAVLRGLKI